MVRQDGQGNYTGLRGFIWGDDPFMEKGGKQTAVVAAMY